MRAWLHKHTFYIVTGGLFLLVVIFSMFLGKLVIISGASMEPTYQTGDIAVALRVSDAHTLQKGDIVVFPYEGRELVKRVSELRDDGLYVLGDNPEHSTDSREFGTIPYDEVQYKVFFAIPSFVKYGILVVGVVLAVLYFGHFWPFVKKELPAEENCA